MNWQLYIGTYTQALLFVEGKGNGIYRLDMDRKTGVLNAPALVARATNPSFLTTDPLQRWLFSVNELEQWRGKPSGAITAYSIQHSGRQLQYLNQRLSHGAAPCYLSVAPDSASLWVANYVTGTVAALPIKPDGRLRPAVATHKHVGQGPHTVRQEGPHAHSIQPDPSGKWVIAADLGADRLYVYRRRKGVFEPATSVPVHPGAGPRHFAFSGDGRRLYLANELDSTVSTFAWDAEKCTLEETQVVPAVPNGYAQGNTLADLHLHPSGRWLYASNRGHDSLAVFTVTSDGFLAPFGHIPTLGRTPRNFAITPDGRFLIAANQDSHNLVVFRIEQRTGMLEPTGIEGRIPSPVCVVVAEYPTE